MVGLFEILMLAGVPGTIRLQLRVPLALAITLTLWVADRTILHRAGFRAPGPWWVLLGPVYLFLRPGVVGARVAMGAAWCACFVAWLVVPTLLAATVGVHISTDRVAGRIQADLERQTGLEVSVTCPPPRTVKIGAGFDCALHSGPYDATATVTVMNSYGGFQFQTRTAVAPPSA